MRKILKVVVPVLALACLLSACGADRTITRDFGDFSIACPKGWDARSAETVEPGAVFLQLLMPENDNHRSHIDFIMRLYPGLSVDDFTEKYAQDVVSARGGEVGAELSLDAFEVVTLGNCSAVAIRYSGNVDGRGTVFTEQIVPLEERLYQISYVVLSESDIPGMEQVMSTVSFH